MKQNNKNDFIDAKIEERDANQLKLYKVAVAVYLNDKCMKEKSINEVNIKKIDLGKNRLRMVIFNVHYI